jgi:hypothetical protein
VSSDEAKIGSEETSMYSRWNFVLQYYLPDCSLRVVYVLLILGECFFL